MAKIEISKGAQVKRIGRRGGRGGGEIKKNLKIFNSIFGQRPR